MDPIRGFRHTSFMRQVHKFWEPINPPEMANLFARNLNMHRFNQPHLVQPVRSRAGEILTDLFGQDVANGLCLVPAVLGFDWALPHPNSPPKHEDSSRS
ncbi:hypothetical protein CEP54_014220 [Fusarium duplospermum]|uniref:Uncharacterized protein n=1 Tax=Fusarium duplospermum TaxID=1325734 RepID=A0A428NXX1_9HYPO|nr:hypothetical protein CEP54_014220 [Fusarium duplospermum]